MCDRWNHREATKAHRAELRHEHREQKLHNKAMHQAMRGNIVGAMISESKANHQHHLAENAHHREMAARATTHHNHHGHHHGFGTDCCGPHGHHHHGHHHGPHHGPHHHGPHHHGPHHGPHHHGPHHGGPHHHHGYPGYPAH